MALGPNRLSAAIPQIALTETEAQLRLEQIFQKGRWVIIVGGVPQILIRGDSPLLHWLGLGVLLVTTLWARHMLNHVANDETPRWIRSMSGRVVGNRTGRIDPVISVIALITAVGDTLAATAVMYGVIDDPNDTITLIPLLIGAGFALHWGPIAVVPAAIMSTTWQLIAASQSGDAVQIDSISLRILAISAICAVIGFTMREMRTYRQAAALMFNTSRDLAATLDRDGRIIQVNEAGKTLLGYEPAEWIGRSARDLVISDDSNGRAPTDNDTETSEVALRHRDGTVVWIEATMVRDPVTGATHLIGRDVTQRRSDETELRRRAERDFLTGVGNRSSLSGRLERQVAAGIRPGVAFVDLDEFKRINDTYGHLAGDEVLVETARRLVKAVGDRGWVARYGGDEFCVVSLDPENLNSLVESIRIAMVKQFAVGDDRVTITATIGTASHRAGEGLISIEKLVDRADRDMYATKRAHGWPTGNLR